MLSARRLRLEPSTSRTQMLVGNWSKLGYTRKELFAETFKRVRPSDRKVGASFPKSKGKEKEVIEIEDDEGDEPDDGDAMDVDE
jgi:hypothetical protein